MSDKPLAERLQVKGARRLAVLGAPTGFGPIVVGADRQTGVSEAEVVLLFTPDRATLDIAVPEVAKAARADAIIWIAYPKLTSRQARDLNRDVIHTLMPRFGLDAVSQIAVDADWSAMRMKRIG